MNTTGDGEEHPYAERLSRDLPLSAPVVADVLPDRTTESYPEYPSAPAPPARGFPGDGAPAAAEGRLSGETSPAAPAPVRFARHSAPVPPDPRPPGDDQGPADEPASPRAGHAADEEGSGADRDAGRDFAPEPPPQPSYLLVGSQDEPPEDPTRVILRKHLDALRVKAANASSWLETSAYYARMVNRDGVVPVTARFSRDDIEFLGRAREEVLGFAELGLRLLELHAPLDAGGISTDPSSPILRCRSCMWRWPCPTFRMLTDAVSQLPRPGSPGR
jgi:hypothetical protein